MTDALQDVLDFWYADEMRSAWFKSTPSLDEQIRERFEATWQAARDGELDHWRESASGCLALAIVLDQFPLNMYRGEARSFATEQQAVRVTLYALEQGFDKQLPEDRLAFLYMPLMHSENAEHQALSVRLFEAARLQDNARFARHHQQIIQRFGRFPHRNVILGRQSSAEEQAYLNSSEAFLG